MRALMGEAHDRAHETAERFRLAFESDVSGMALTAPDGRFLQVNRALCEITGYSEQELLQRDFKSITHPEDRLTDAQHHQALIEGAEDIYETEKRYVHRDGHDVWVQIGVTAVRDEQSQVSYFIAQAYDVTARRRFEDELAHRALHDPLTGLPNRALLMDRLTHAMVRMRRVPGEIAVLFVDLDRFKLVNDGMGHGVGDSVLLEAARRLSDAARAEDTVARFGGDEFTILCEGAGKDVAVAVATRILAAFEQPFSHEGREFHLSVSLGIRVGGDAGAAPESLLRDADLALYAAKEHGRARYELFDLATCMGGFDRLTTEQALRIALRDRQLRLQYQPEVDLTTGRVTAVEALVRWEHPERGLVPPGEFIPVAEECELIIPMGGWILREACRQLSSWRRSGAVGADLRMAVNVSARQLAHPDLPEVVAGALAAAELTPSALCLEITESAVLQDTEVMRANLRAINRLGVSIALDDFGMGFSSLGQIRELPHFDVIKIDRSFTAGLGDNDSDTAVVTALLSLVRSLKLTAVAEGIETEEQLQLLRSMGCETGQGFLFARPQDPDVIASLLSGGQSLMAPLDSPRLVV
jgi:diguanylate cyclase (GGDEF)-like protein/PAS domain S-box-containing protein